MVPAKVAGDAPSRDGLVEVTKKLGMEALQAGRYTEAADHLTMCLQAGADDAEVNEALREAKKHIGTVKILLNEAGAKVLIDGKPYIPVLDGPEGFMTPGVHKFWAEKAGFAPDAATLDIKAGEQRELLLMLVRNVYRQILGLPPELQMDISSGPQPEAPTWPTAMMVGGFSAFRVGGAMSITGLVKTANAKTEQVLRGRRLAGARADEETWSQGRR